PSACLKPRLLPAAKPRLPPARSSFTPGNSRSMRSAEPSLLALSTTTARKSAQVCCSSALRQRMTNSPPFQLTTMTVTRATDQAFIECSLLHPSDDAPEHYGIGGEPRPERARERALVR